MKVGLMGKKLLMIGLLIIGMLAAVSAYAARTVIVINDLFVDFSVTSDNPYWINDSQIVHKQGRINYEQDGRYILTNARTYYSILQEAYGGKLSGAWSKRVGTDFSTEVIDYYSQRPGTNISEDLDLRSYWYERKEKVFWDK
ncbi:hypothetical protein HYS31_07105 [Candidatus Woesearchaeota archaeon]|nr:hypothetical protein [Candidatus Woesearchaeota archaeon]